MQPERRQQQQPQRRSDSAKLSFEIYRAVWLGFVGKAVEEPREVSDFQADYEGSIPFTRSNVFNRLCRLWQGDLASGYCRANDIFPRKSGERRPVEYQRWLLASIS